MRIFSFVLAFAIAAFSQNASIPGTIKVLPSTILNIAVEWPIQGDDNRNGIVGVQYKKTGQTQYKDGMPLHRIPADSTNPLVDPKRYWANMHSGSIFNLQPGSQYDILLTLNDPDGGSTSRSVTASTYPVPRPSSNDSVIVLPPGYNSTLITTSGTPAKWNVYSSPDGRAQFGMVSLMNQQYVILEGIKVKHSNPNFTSGKGIYLSGASHCAIRRCSIYAVDAIEARGDGIENCYIADNYIEGTGTWEQANLGPSGPDHGKGIYVAGHGNVICHNIVKGFRESIHLEPIGTSVYPHCNDVYGNDVRVGLADAIRLNYTTGNNRIVGNRITNGYHGLTAQPSMGGPEYFIRNVMYNICQNSFKFFYYSVGNIVLHNTVVKPGDGICNLGGMAMENAYFRNNLGIGGPGGALFSGGTGRAMNIDEPGVISTYDYDAVGAFQTPYDTKIGAQSFGQVELNGIEDITVDNSTLNHVFSGVAFPSDPLTEYAIPDLRPVASALFVDKGLPISSINDGFSGSAPDCGAYEAGQALPVYGPRPAGVDEQTPYDSMAVEEWAPTSLKLHGVKGGGLVSAFPNPFRSSVVIRALGGGKIQWLKVYDVNGRLVYQSKPQSAAGWRPQKFHEWDGSNKVGCRVSNGQYLMAVKTKKYYTKSKVVFSK